MKRMEMKRILHAIYTAVDDEIRCHANQAQLAAYIDAELSGEEVVTRYPELHAQLATCASCQTAYTELKALLTLEAEAKLVQPPVAVNFNFNYLAPKHEPVREPPVVEPASWRLDTLGRLIVALSAEFMRSLQPVRLQPSALKAQGRQSLFELTSPALATDLKVTIAARPVRGEPDRCTVTVTADIPSRGGWPNLAGSQVVLKLGERVIKTQTSDAFGKVVFAGIEQNTLGHLTIEVTPAPQHPPLDHPPR